MTPEFAVYLFHYAPVAIFLAIAAAFGVGTLALSYVVHPRIASSEKLSAYECGSEPISDARMPFPMRYYVIAMLFVVFDVELIFLYPWAVAFDQIGLFGWIEMVIFILLFVAGYAYAWRKDALEWD